MDWNLSVQPETIGPIRALRCPCAECFKCSRSVVMVQSWTSKRHSVHSYGSRQLCRCQELGIRGRLRVGMLGAMNKGAGQEREKICQ